jgi:phospholipase C
MAVASTIPDPARSGLEHVVLVMMENRSFDHFLGWLPGADGKQAGLAYRDSAGVSYPTHALAPDYQGCGHPSPDHSYTGGRIALAGGACDGWLRVPANDPYAIGYYTRADLAFLGLAASAWTTCDHYFAAIMSETYPNRIYQHAAQTDRLVNHFALCSLPTIWDRLAEHGLAGRYYFNDVPTVALWGLKYVSISRPFSVFLSDCARGTLPQLAFVDPRFVGESRGTSGDDHPPADIRTGEAFLNQVYTAVTTSPNWSSTLLVVTYDEWGGFFDHVPPRAAPIPPADRAAGNTDGLRGFRVPALLISPWSARGAVNSMEFDHTSLLRLVEWRWGLAPLTVRDASANNLAEALDFSRPSLAAPAFVVPAGRFGGPCPQPGPARGVALRNVARSRGWHV